MSWKNCIVGEGMVKSSDLLANPHNWRIHPQKQQEALKSSLSEIGWIQRIIVNRRTGHVVDGHARAEQVISAGEQEVPVIYVDLSEEQEKLALAVLDPISAMATADKQMFTELIEDVNTGEAALMELLSEMSESWDIDGIDAPDMPDGEKEPFQQITFTVHDEQAELIQSAISKAKSEGFGVSGLNENGNGNALAKLAEFYLG